MPHEEMPTILEEEPDDAHRIAVEYADTPPQLTLPWREHLAAGNDAYQTASERHTAHGLDAETVQLYEQASSHLLSAAFLGPENTIDPHSELKLASSLGWQAKAMPSGVFYEDHGSGHIDKKSNLQEIAHKTHRHAIITLLGKTSRKATQTGLAPDIDSAEIAEAAVEAAIEAGTDEHVDVYGIDQVDSETPSRLEAKGKEAILRFVGAHAMDPQHGAEFTARMAEKEATDIHELPLAA